MVYQANENKNKEDRRENTSTLFPNNCRVPDYHIIIIFLLWCNYLPTI